MVSDRSLPLSLYLKLEQGQMADLEVVSKASIEFVKAISDIAEFIDPSVRVKVTIRDGQEGSLKLNSVVEWITGRPMSPDEEKRAKRRATALGLIFTGFWWLLDGVGSHYLSKSLDALDKKVLDMIEEQDIDDKTGELHKECMDIVMGVVGNKIAEEHRRKFYAALQKDPVIIGVGISSVHNAIPKVIVTRDHFADMAREDATTREVEKRVRTERMEMLVVQPRLSSDNKPWRFAVSSIEFAAKITDTEFLSNTLSGRNKLTMAEGLIMDADIETEEEGTDGAWVTKNRTVTKVHEVRMSPQQQSLL